ncbi:MAG: TAXI family TRAP transporter solute-binding subunit [Acidimicrobiia bacterium]
MRPMKITAILSAALMAVAACGGTATPGAVATTAPAATTAAATATAAGVPKPSGKALAFLTGGTAGTYYPYGGALANLWNAGGIGVNVTVQATGASVENIRQLATKAADIALVQNDIADYAANATEMFKEKQQVSGIAIMYPEVIQVVARADAGINTIADLKGKRVGVGAPGSGNEANARQILTVANIAYADLAQASQLSYAEMATAMKDRRLDAMFVTAGVPNAAIQDIASTQAIKIVPITGDFATSLKTKYSFFADTTVAGGVYTGVAAETKTVGVQATLVARTDLEENVVYWLTKTMFDQQAQLAQAHAKGKELVRANALAGMSIAVHPGAQKFYTEVGVRKP